MTGEGPRDAYASKNVTRSTGLTDLYKLLGLVIVKAIHGRLTDCWGQDDWEPICASWRDNISGDSWKM